MKLFDFEKYKSDLEKLCPRHKFDDSELARFVCEIEERILKETTGDMVKFRNFLSADSGQIKVPEKLSAGGEFYKLYLLYAQKEMFFYNGEYEKYTNTANAFEGLFSRFLCEYIQKNPGTERSFAVW